MKNFLNPPKLKPGDKVAIVAPSSGAAALFPWVYQQGLNRIREFGLEPVEYPTTKKDGQFLSSHPQNRAEDINLAYSDKNIKAIMATIGGNDQIKILDYLDQKVISGNPKLFLGLSDNTNLHLYLWNLGLVSYYGGSVMQQWAQNGQMDDYTVKNFHSALMVGGRTEITPSSSWTDIDFEWSDQSLLTKSKPMQTNPGWYWHNPGLKTITGRLWGGCWEILAWHLYSHRYLPKLSELSGSVLFMETSEEMPAPDNVYRMLTGLGIRGILKNFSAVLIGRPKTRHRNQLPPEGQDKYLLNQRQAIIQALTEYAPHVPAVFGLDFGHTDPQVLVPSGSIVEIDPVSRRIFFVY